jgi:long-subunit fatty acid transport protein
MRTALAFLVLTSAPAITTAAVAAEDGAPAARSEIINDPALSDLYISPAQLHQATRPWLEGLVAFGQGESKLSAEHLDIKAPAEIQAVALLFETPIPQTKATFRGNLTQVKTTSKPKTKATGAPFGNGTEDDKRVETETTVSPALAYDVTPEISVGAAFDIVSDDQTHDSGGHGSFHYTRFIPGVAFHRATFEVGLFYEPTININDPDGSVNAAGAVGLHLAGLVAPRLVAGAVIKYLRSRDLDEAAAKNNLDTTLALESRPSSALMAGASLGYTAESANGAEDRNPGNIATMAFALYGSYDLSERAAVGVKLAHIQSGNQHGKIDTGAKAISTDISTDVTLLALTGSYMF